MAISRTSLGHRVFKLPQRQIPMGTADTAWTGIGAVGIFLVGIWFFGDLSRVGRGLGALLVLTGAMVPKLVH